MAKGYIPKNIYELNVIFMQNARISEENMKCYLMKADEKINTLEIAQCLKETIHEFMDNSSSWSYGGEEKQCLKDIANPNKRESTRFYLTKHTKNGYIAYRLHDSIALNNDQILHDDMHRDNTIIEIRVYN